jgi:hypothetical protein
MTEPRDQTVAGVTLRQYAIVIAGRADELPLADLLSLAVVPQKAWPRAEEAWGERLLADLDDDGPLADELAVRVSEARKLWERPLPPLDSELRAWLDFERAWAREVDGGAFLAKVGMRAADITRLQDLWAERMGADPTVQRAAMSILAEEPAAPPRPAPGPASIIGAGAGRIG